jgi:NTP pyrophosphatase (non-canonical NTP hydrolase)
MDTDSEYVVIRKDDLETAFCQVSGGGLTRFMEHVDEKQLPLITIPEFQKEMFADSKRWFGEEASIDLTMHVFGLVGEAGEVADEIKKVLRGSQTLEEAAPKIAEELVDTMIYLFLLFVILGIDPGPVYAQKREYNEQRFGPKDPPPPTLEIAR